REEVLAVVSHDLRNPLQAIAMAATFVAGATADDAIRRHVRIIDNAGRQMRHLIDELLEASRIDSGQLELHQARTAIRELIERTAELFQASASVRGIALTSEAPAGAVAADRERAIEVLSNLVDNALKFTRRGGHVTIRGEATGDEVRFSVADDGP